MAPETESLGPEQSAIPGTEGPVLEESMSLQVEMEAQIIDPGTSVLTSTVVKPSVLLLISSWSTPSLHPYLLLHKVAIDRSGFFLFFFLIFVFNYRIQLYFKLFLWFRTGHASCIDRSKAFEDIALGGNVKAASMDVEEDMTALRMP